MYNGMEGKLVGRTLLIAVFEIQNRPVKFETEFSLQAKFLFHIKHRHQYHHGN